MSGRKSESESSELNYITGLLYTKIAGECGMRNFIISVLILTAIAMSCQALNPVNISQESGMSILASHQRQFIEHVSLAEQQHRKIKPT